MAFEYLNFPISMKHHICWGRDGLIYYGAAFAAVVIVDVLSFCTTVDIALSKGCSIIPTKMVNEEHLCSFAQQHQAILAKKRTEPGITLSPASMKNASYGQTIILPSLNGSSLVDIASNLGKPVFAGCLRNAHVLSALLNFKGFFPVLFVASGERYSNQMLRPSIEDYWGVGSILAEINGDKTIEAQCAVQSFEYFSHNIQNNLAACESGQELIIQGFHQDVELASEYNSSSTISILSNKAGCFQLVSAMESL